MNHLIHYYALPDWQVQEQGLRVRIGTAATMHTVERKENNFNACNNSMDICHVSQT